MNEMQELVIKFHRELSVLQGSKFRFFSIPQELSLGNDLSK